MSSRFYIMSYAIRSMPSIVTIKPRRNYLFSMLGFFQFVTIFFSMSGIASTMASSLKAGVETISLDAKRKEMAKDVVDPKLYHDGKITTNHGQMVSDTENWLKATNGQTSGPFLIEDVQAFEKIHRFDHERIPERVVHARGSGAHGYFRVLDDTAVPYTYAPVLTDTSRKTPVFVRFSTVQGPRGSADTVRDVRGFAIKFYTQEGNWDLVGNNIPVFFIQDAIQFPDFVHAVKPEPHNEVPTGQTAHNNLWDFFVQEKATSHMIMWAMSDRAIPRSYRMMQGFGVNTYTLMNAEGKRHFVKFHLTPELGVHSLAWDEALKIAGQDPDFHRKDLNEAIENGAYPKWSFGIQVLTEEDQHKFDFDILDATKVWPEDQVPVKYFAELVLDRCVDEFFPETEQAAFCTSHVVPGIGFSDDPLLQGRIFSYLDTQLSRLGTNWEELAINRPVCPVLNNIRDGQHRQKIAPSNVNYWPNRYGNNPPAKSKEGGYVDYPQRIESATKTRARGEKFKEYAAQARLFYNSLTPYERAHLVNAYAFELSHCDDPLVYGKAVERLNELDHELAKTVAQKVGGEIPSKPAGVNPGHKAKGLSQLDFLPKDPSIKSRRVAILIADGFDLTIVEALKGAILAGSALPWVIGPRRREINSSAGPTVWADHHFEDQRSTMFDAIVIPPGLESIKALSGQGRVIHWVREAFGHCKTIGAIGEGVGFLRDVVQLPGVEYAAKPASTDVTDSYGVITVGTYNVTSAVKDVFQGDGFFATFARSLSKHRCWERELDGLTSKVAF